ncbi:alcohol oxidase [Bimuria novae-zelandiae CBS 107.79]|uniref:Alcohol oxidase n=1 Tax=Bimuria novae-zelandiae CBS 107.79 TaxID=1447943 RepID=A0A6A5V4J6_9PLEO|nr:alcohol oxidase [Bimuria novae-zelandiae CBS 107.79]
MRSFVVVAQSLGLAAALTSGQLVERDTAPQAATTYDYVIVGGGVTGLIVANRLTENKKTTVLVIEAGTDDLPFQQRLPYGAASALNESLLWPNYVSEPEPFLNNKIWKVRVAAVLGGGSVVNGMFYDRGSAADYDAWEALGNSGWGWKGLYPYFKKGTTFIPPPRKTAEDFNITWDPAVYGNGPLHLGISDFQYPDILPFFAAYQGAGVKKLLDGNNGKQAGLSWYANTMNPLTGERSQARNSYFDPVKSTRSNLKLLLRTEATELVLENGKKLTAKGVKVLDKTTGKTSTVYANKEVVLAAGSVNTPKLLQLSGIGPRSVLQAAGIKVKLAHDGVGANFQDHPYTLVTFNTSFASNPNPQSLATDPAFNASAWAQYEANKTGPLTQGRGNSLAMISLPQVAPKTYGTIAKQIQDQKNDSYLPAIYTGSKKLIAGVAAQRKVLAQLFQNKNAAVVEYPVGPGGAGVLVGLEKPLGRGSITINPADPRGPPKILYNALSNPVDKAVLASCVRYLRTVWQRPEVAKFKLVETSPGAQYTTDEAIIDKMNAAGTISPTLSHPSGSCAMMPEKYGGCVSDKLLFYGVEKLSIVDASILPLVPSQHIQSTMYAVGEKAADLIKARA